jgi:hypothetical protein
LDGKVSAIELLKGVLPAAGGGALAAAPNSTENSACFIGGFRRNLGTSAKKQHDQKTSAK